MPQANHDRLASQQEIPDPEHAPTVLVVDDETTILDLLRDLLEDEGFVVHLARNGHEALTIASAVRPDLILTDLMLPMLDGRALAQHLRAQPHTATIPVLLMSAAAHAARDEAFIAKPFDIADLLQQINQQLGRR